jgi:hypothetical protein
MRKSILVLLTGVVMALLGGRPRARADEGMWLFNALPVEKLKKDHGFTPTKDWLDHVQKASVRIGNLGSGSFVSPHGLVMTNHHVALDTLEKLSSKEKDYVADGFLAKTQDDEVKSKDLELNVLMSIEDVTKDVQAAVKDGMSPAEAFAARRAVISRIEAQSEKETKLRSQVVTLYQGGMYHLYRFKRYDDVRLVFAPEMQAAFFGGDADNFNYPRYCLDVAFFRVYEDGKPATIEHYLKWSKAGARDGELIFVSGNPGRTNRGSTVAELKYLRDIGYPFLLRRLYRWEVMANVFSGRGEEQARIAKDFLFSVANSRKARDGGLAGLLDPRVMSRKEAEEKKIRDAVATHPELKEASKAWNLVAQAQQVRAQNIQNYTLFEAGGAFNTTLFGYARRLVRAADEFAKPNEKRLTGYTDADKKNLELELFSTEPVYPEFEIVKLANSLTWLCEQVGYENKSVQAILNGKSPDERATELIQGSKLTKVAERKKLYEGGKEAVAASQDPMIVLARMVDPYSRKVRKVIETQVEEPQRQAYDQIAKAKFALYGPTFYPDATFTPRLSFGIVKGYEEEGKELPFETTFAGLYKHAAEHGNKDVFALPSRLAKGKNKLHLKTPFNFVCTADIIGGNSGSPVINKEGEVVGLIFDGNLQSLVWDFLYTDVQGRSIAVHSQGLLEALGALYGAEDLVNEIRGAAVKEGLQ